MMKLIIIIYDKIKINEKYGKMKKKKTNVKIQVYQL